MNHMEKMTDFAGWSSQKQEEAQIVTA